MSLFDQLIAASRTAAVPVLEKSAKERGTIISVCSYCKRFIGEKPGDGVTGISHGCCDECFPKMDAEVQ
jgi:hypothetical protein